VSSPPERAALIAAAGRIAAAWNAFLDTLSDEQLEIADTVLRRAAARGDEEVRRLRAAAGEPSGTGR
jgi:hypothetical protein